MSDCKRVIIANYRFFIAGGPERYMFNFIRAAEERGIEVIPFSVHNPRNEPTPYSEYFAKPRSDSQMYSDTKKSLKNAYGMIRATVWNYDAAKRIRRLIRDTKPDAVYILHEINHLSPSIIRAAKKEGVRVVHRISDFFMFCARYDFLREDNVCEECLHGDYSSAINYRCMKNSTAGTWLRVCAMRLYASLGVFDDVDQYIATCEFSRKKLIEGGIDKDRITVIPTFVDTKEIEPCYEDKGYFLFLGRMARHKGVIYAIEAMRHIELDRGRLIVTGNLNKTSEDYEAIRELIDRYNLADRVEFVGFKSGAELNSLIDGAMCVLCPSIWYDNMPNSVLEAYAHGKPVIASKLGSLEEIVEDNYTGLLFTPKDSYDLACKMRYMLDNPVQRNLMGHNARLKCEECYNPNIHMERVLNILGLRNYYN